MVARLLPLAIVVLGDWGLLSVNVELRLRMPPLVMTHVGLMMTIVVVASAGAGVEAMVVVAVVWGRWLGSLSLAGAGACCCCQLWPYLFWK